MIAAGILLSPVFAFLLAVVVEILIGVLTQVGMPALVIIALSVTCGGLLLRKYRTRSPTGICWAIRRKAPAAGAERRVGVHADKTARKGRLRRIAKGASLRRGAVTQPR